jgi:hypothetical protein
MFTSTSYRDAIMRPAELRMIPFLALESKFMIRQPPTVVEGFSGNTGEFTGSGVLTDDQRMIQKEEVLVRVPSLRESKARAIVLQRWVGRVVHIEAGRFLAVLDDRTNLQNPPEEVELDTTDLSEGDLPLLTEGATFYLSMGYRISPGGQRERIAAVRFARQPRLNESEVNRINEQADRMAAFLESD